MAAVVKQMPTKRPRDISAETQPSIRTFVDWTPSRIRSAEIAADGGGLHMAANLCEWILGDDEAGPLLLRRAQSLLGLEPTFEASGDGRRKSRAVRALEAGEDWWAGYPESELTRFTIWGILLGVAPGRHNWEENEEHGNRWLPMPEFWHPQHLRQDQQTDRWLIRVRSTGGTGGLEEELVAGDGNWLLHTPYGKNRPWSMGLWRGLARLVLIKWYAKQDWAQASEKGSLLVVTSKAPESGEVTSRENRAQLATDLQGRGTQAVAVLPEDFDAKLVGATANSESIFNAQIAMANKAIAIAINGGNLTTDVRQGSRAAAEVQERAGEQKNLKFDAQSLTTTIHDQSLTWWAEFNFGDSKLAPWPVYPVEPEEDLKEKTESEEKAFANVDKAELLGFKVDRKKFLEAHKIAWADPGERPPEPEPVEPDEPVNDPAEPEEARNPGSQSAENRTPGAGQFRARAAAASGYDNGAEYADRLHGRAARHGAKELAPTIAALVAEIQKADSYDAAREAIAERYGRMLPPVELASLLDAALTMGQLAGVLGVREDVPEFSDES